MKKVLILSNSTQKYNKDRYDLVILNNRALVNKITDKKVITNYEIEVMKNASKYYEVEEV